MFNLRYIAPRHPGQHQRTMSEISNSTVNRSLKLAAPRSLYFAIFAISGFSGLIYESIWSHYLKLFLGHAAYAQSLVLIIFMGGMAVGSWLASRFSQRAKTPILWYAAIEAIVGIAALLFHGVFTGVVDVFYSSVLPSVGVPILGATLKWLAASLLIVPQSILLGMTFPLMSAGIIRRFPSTPGGSIAMLYFTNSIGASIGVLASGFWMIKSFGLPGTVFTAGLLNVGLALTVWVLVRLDTVPSAAPIPTTQSTEARDSLEKLFLVAAFITGAASFIYEISWIRMLSLVLGATTHSFELMLSAFIIGLAFGGLWIKRRIDQIADPVRFSAYVQLIMGIFALLTIPVYMMSYDWMVWLISALERNDAGFMGFTVASQMIALAVMLPTTFMAGMTLPLFTYVLIQKGQGESSIGRIYAANTIGAIVGVLFAVHIGLSLLGLKNLIVFGAALDLGLAVALLSRSSRQGVGKMQLITGGAVGAAAIVATLTVASLNENILASGVYRYGRVSSDDAEVMFYRDGKTASVSLRRDLEGRIILATNGKPDAAIQPDQEKAASPDEITMTLAGALPFAYYPNARRVANIGMGSGQTTHTLLGNSRIEQVDTIEIEREMASASRQFGAAVERAYQDPRSQIIIEDAKTYFSLHNSVYDIIIAEPSNPWVSGVASLFSTEFYQTVKKHLEDDGVFVQWIQIYEFSDSLAESIMKALTENFDDFAIYATDSLNVLIFARNNGPLGDPDFEQVLYGKLAESLTRVGINSPADLMVRKFADSGTLGPYLRLARTPANSDYFPYVDLNAGKARYKSTRSEMFNAWSVAAIPLLEMLYEESIDYDTVTLSTMLSKNDAIAAAQWLHEKVTSGSLSDPDLEDSKPMNRLRYLADWVLLSSESCVAVENAQRWSETIHDLAVTALPHLNSEKAVEVVDAIFASKCAYQDQGFAAQWRDLYQAVASRNAVEMSKNGQHILSENSELPRGRMAYVLSASMLGDIAAGNPEGAYDTWQRFGAEEFEGVKLAWDLRLLLSIAVEAAENPETVAAR